MADSSQSSSKCLCLASLCFFKKQSSPLKPKQNLKSIPAEGVGVNGYNHRIGRHRGILVEKQQNIQHAQSNNIMIRERPFQYNRNISQDWSYQVSNIQQFDQLFRNPIQNNQENNPDHQRSFDTNEVRQRNKVRIKTSICKKDIQFVLEFPSTRDQQLLFKYCCPICLRYFNTILVSSCCRNYICRLCIGDMAKRAKSNKQFVIKCSHCLEIDFKLNDVSPSDNIKFYTDTPFKFKVFTPAGQVVQSSEKTVIESPPCIKFSDQKSVLKNQSFPSDAKVKISPQIQEELPQNFEAKMNDELSFRIPINQNLNHRIKEHSIIEEESKEVPPELDIRATNKLIHDIDTLNSQSRNNGINDYQSIQRTLSGQSLQNQILKLKDSNKMLISHKLQTNQAMSNEKLKIQNKLPLQSLSDFNNQREQTTSKVNANNQIIASDQNTNLRVKTRILQFPKTLSEVKPLELDLQEEQLRVDPFGDNHIENEVAQEDSINHHHSISSNHSYQQQASQFKVFNTFSTPAKQQEKENLSDVAQFRKIATSQKKGKNHIDQMSAQFDIRAL